MKKILWIIIISNTMDLLLKSTLSAEDCRDSKVSRFRLHLKNVFLTTNIFTKYLTRLCCRNRTYTWSRYHFGCQCILWKSWGRSHTSVCRQSCSLDRTELPLLVQLNNSRTLFQTTIFPLIDLNIFQLSIWIFF